MNIKVWKKISIVIICLSILLLSSCSVIDGIVENVDGDNLIETTRSQQLSTLMQSEGDKIETMSREIMRCLVDDDREALTTLFCEEIQQSPNFQDEIDDAFDFFKADNLNWSEIDRTAGGGSSTREGQKTMWYVRPNIPYIKVGCYENDDQDYGYNYYAISYDWKIIDAENESLEGLHYIRITLLNLDSVTVGNFDKLHD